MTDELVAFLKARVDEDEQAARAATQGRWFWADPSTSDFPQGDRDLLADEGEWRTCDYVCTWSGEDNLHRGQPGKPGHEHRVTSVVVGAWGYDASGINVDDADAAHIARWDPAQVLAEVQAKRRIIDLHALDVKEYPARFDPLSGERIGPEYEVTCDVCGWASLDPSSACETLRLLALPYADRDGYRAEWAPDTEVNRG